MIAKSTSRPPAPPKKKAAKNEPKPSESGSELAASMAAPTGPITLNSAMAMPSNAAAAANIRTAAAVTVPGLRFGSSMAG